MNASGWAVRHGSGYIYINTVHDTRRGAIVNWLVTEGGLMVMNHNNDEQIEHWWRTGTIGTGVEVIEVEIVAK